MRGQAPGCGCPEAQYGFELYGAVHRVLGRKVTLHAEFSYTKRGRIDFFLLAERWGIEVLKDGDRLAEQISRCKPSGRYGSWGVVKDYTILDFRTKMPSKSYAEPNLIFVIFDENHENVKVYDNQLVNIASYILANSLG